MSVPSLVGFFVFFVTDFFIILIDPLISVSCVFSFLLRFHCINDPHLDIYHVLNTTQHLSVGIQNVYCRPELGKKYSGHFSSQPSQSPIMQLMDN